MNLKCKTLSDWHFNIIQCLYDWQTLASGILALIAAFITIYFLRKQIVQNNDFEVQKLRRKHDSFRVVLTLTLSQICSATEKAIYLLAKLRIQSSDTRKLSVTERRSLYSISPDVISSLQAIIETTDDKALISIIYRITRNIQVTVARIENMNTRHDSDLEEQIQDCTSIYTLVESLFEYARREINQCPEFVEMARLDSVLFSQLRNFHSINFHENLDPEYRPKYLWHSDPNADSQRS